MRNLAPLVFALGFLGARVVSGRPTSLEDMVVVGTIIVLLWAIPKIVVYLMK